MSLCTLDAFKSRETRKNGKRAFHIYLFHDVPFTSIIEIEMPIILIATITTMGMENDVFLNCWKFFFKSDHILWIFYRSFIL